METYNGTHWFDASEFIKPEAEWTSVCASERFNRERIVVTQIEE